jgi:uncharacterized protein YbgA (DUF1722 family)/uncharacterized protein YbbK (DUF523 family)
LKVGGERIKIGISSCLLGNEVRYDGGHKLDHFLRDTLGAYTEYVPVCPEVEMGLPIPREAMRLVGDPQAPRLVTRKSGVDYTERMKKWAEKRLDSLEREGLRGFIFKSRSPSSGMGRVKVYTEAGMPAGKGAGIFARVLQDRLPLLPFEDEGRLHDAGIRENFIERIFVFHRWKRLVKSGGELRDLIDFHSRHKYLIMSHSPAHLRTLGKLVAAGKEMPKDQLFDDYLDNLMAGLKLMATVKKNSNVLQHILGYFKKDLSADEKQEVLEVIGEYHRELVPLIVPVVLLRHFVRKYQEHYLAEQHYLYPHPTELMLRNHV